MNWLVADYIKYYENIVSDLQCKEILGCTENTFVPSTYSSHDNKIKGEERVRMDEFWVKNDSVLWPTLLSCFEKVIKNTRKIFLCLVCNVPQTLELIDIQKVVSCPNIVIIYTIAMDNNMDIHKSLLFYISMIIMRAVNFLSQTTNTYRREVLQ